MMKALKRCVESLLRKQLGSKCNTGKVLGIALRAELFLFVKEQRLN